MSTPERFQINSPNCLLCVREIEGVVREYKNKLDTEDEENAFLRKFAEHLPAWFLYGFLNWKPESKNPYLTLSEHSNDKLSYYGNIELGDVLGELTSLVLSRERTVDGRLRDNLVLDAIKKYDPQTCATGFAGFIYGKLRAQLNRQCMKKMLDDRRKGNIIFSDQEARILSKVIKTVQSDLGKDPSSDKFTSEDYLKIATAFNKNNNKDKLTAEEAENLLLRNQQFNVSSLDAMLFEKPENAGDGMIIDVDDDVNSEFWRSISETHYAPFEAPESSDTDEYFDESESETDRPESGQDEVLYEVSYAPNIYYEPTAKMSFSDEMSDNRVFDAIKTYINEKTNEDNQRALWGFLTREVVELYINHEKELYRANHPRMTKTIDKISVKDVLKDDDCFESFMERLPLELAGFPLTEHLNKNIIYFYVSERARPTDKDCKTILAYPYSLGNFCNRKKGFLEFLEKTKQETKHTPEEDYPTPTASR